MFNWKYVTFASFFISTPVVKLLLNLIPCCFKNALYSTKCGPLEQTACQGRQWPSIGWGEMCSSTLPGLHTAFEQKMELLIEGWTDILIVYSKCQADICFVCVCVCLRALHCWLCTVCKPCSVKVINDRRDSRNHKETLSCMFVHPSACTWLTVGRWASRAAALRPSLLLGVSASRGFHRPGMFRVCTHNEAAASSSGDRNISRFWLHCRDHNFNKTDVVCLSRFMRILDSFVIW